MTQERQIKDFIAEVDRMRKQLSDLRGTLTNMLYNTPSDAPDPIELPKEKNTRKPATITESLSVSPDKGRKDLNLDDFIDALNDSGLDTYEEGWQSASGGGSGCKIRINGEVIAAYEYPGYVEDCESPGSIAHKNLIIRQCYPHPGWEAITQVLRSM